MVSDKVLRRALWCSVPYNLFGAVVFAFPESALGRFAGVPSPVPGIYCALLAYFVVLFGGAYAWLALQPVIDRPLVGLAAFGKGGVFCILVAFWLLGLAPGQGVLSGLGDLVLAGIFAAWVLGRRGAA